MVGPGCRCSPCRMIHSLGLRRFLSSGSFPTYEFFAEISKATPGQSTVTTVAFLSDTSDPKVVKQLVQKSTLILGQGKVHFSPSLDGSVAATLLLTQVQWRAEVLKFNVQLHRAGGGRERGCHTQVAKYQPSVATWKGMLMLIAIESILNQLNKNGLIPPPLETQRPIPSPPPFLYLLRKPSSLPKKFPFYSPVSFLHPTAGPTSPPFFWPIPCLHSLLQSAA